MQETEERRVQSLGWADPLEEGIQPTPVFLPGESHGQRILAGYSPWGHKESDITTNTLTLHFPHSCCGGGLRENKTSEDGCGRYLQPLKEERTGVYPEGTGSIGSYLTGITRV